MDCCRWDFFSTNQLKRKLGAQGFHNMYCKTGLWIHNTCPIQRDIGMEKFGVKYENKVDAKYLMNVLKAHDEMVSKDMGGIFFTITLDRD